MRTSKRSFRVGEWLRQSRQELRRRLNQANLAIEQLEDRTVPALTLNPVVEATIIDSPRGGAADSMSIPLAGRARESATEEWRPTVEFNTAGESNPVTLAILDFTLSGTAGTVRTFDVYVYSGNGAADLADFAAPATKVATVSLSAADGTDYYRLDVTSQVEAIRAAGSSFVGVRFDPVGDTVVTFLSSPQLGVNGAPPLRGQRGWETVPNVIRTNGLEEFRLEVDVGYSVRSVTLQPFGSGALVPPNTGTVTLRDDGLQGDRVAGDYIFTSGPFRYNTSFTLPPSFYGGEFGAVGVGFNDVGDVFIEELNGANSQFLVRPTVGLLRSDIVDVALEQRGSDLAFSDHIINVQTQENFAQTLLRFGGVPEFELTARIYEEFPDAFDFINLLSTNKVENPNRLNGANFHSGSHTSVKVDYTGTGYAITDRTSDYGSAGRLMGINRIDAMDRGLYTGNVTHELLHQWSAYMDPALGISNGAHYLHNSSVGSFLGGAVWIDNGDGSFTIDLEGPTNAAELDLYMMGLLDASGVSPIHVYDPALNKGYSDPYIAADDIIRTTTIDDIIARHGVRTPGPGGAQRDFSIAFVAESHNRLLTATEMTFYEILAAHYTKELPAAEPDPSLDSGWGPITRYFGHGTSWSTLLPGQTEAPNQPPVVASSAFSIPENKTWPFTVGTVGASDPEGQGLVYAITGGNASRAFGIDSRTGRIYVNASSNGEQDFERNPHYELEVLVADTGIPSQFTRQTITVDLTDLNDNAPVVTSGQVLRIAENTSSAALVGSVAATDADTVGGPIRNFRILAGNEQGAFAINANTGQVTVADSSRLNFEQQTSFVLQVTASDSSLTSAAESITIQVDDVNEAPIVGDATFAAGEALGLGSAVGVLTAADPDAGQTLSFRIVSGNASGAFSIDSSTGSISLVGSLDYETTTVYTLTVEVADNGSPGLTRSVTVTINVLDANDNPPAITAGQLLSVAENSASGSIVGSVVANDPDTVGGPLQGYAIVSGNEGAAFVIAPATGLITVSSGANLNHEQRASYTLQVTVSDGTHTSAPQSVTIQVTNINEAPVLDNRTFSIAENSPNGSAVGTVVAADEDAGQSIAYSIVAGNTSEAFAINASTGAITVNNGGALDFETTPVFTLTVRAADNGSPTQATMATVTVNLTDQSEITIDIKPGDATNTINLKRDREVAVAVLSTATFNATTAVDVNSLTFGRTGNENSIVRDRKGKAKVSFSDVNGDGRLDLVVSFEVARTGLQVGDLAATLKGRLTNGVAFTASAPVNVRKS